MSAKISIALIFAAGLGLSACENPDGTKNNTGTGVLIGAGTGAVLGKMIGNDRQSTVLGGIVGAGIGAAIGHNLDEQEKALRRDISGSGAQIINYGDRLVVSMPEGITFATDSDVVRASIQDDILAIARNLQQFPNNTVQVIGHTDNTGTHAYNQSLSERRAGAVANILRSGGVPRGRLVAFGRGETDPIASNGSASGRQANRRVEIVITPNN